MSKKSCPEGTSKMSLAHMPQDTLMLVFSFYMTFDILTVVNKLPLNEILNTAATCKGLALFTETVIQSYMLTPAPFTRFFTEPIKKNLMDSRPNLWSFKLLPEQRARNYTTVDRAGKTFTNDVCQFSVGFIGIKQGLTLHNVDAAMLATLSFAQFIAFRIRINVPFEKVINKYADIYGLSTPLFNFQISERLYQNAKPRLPKGGFIMQDHSIWTLGIEHAVIRHTKPFGWENPHVDAFLTCNADELFVILYFIRNDGFLTKDRLLVRMKADDSLQLPFTIFITKIQKRIQIDRDRLHFVSSYTVDGVKRHHVVNPKDTANQATARVAGQSFKSPLHIFYLTAI